MTTHVDRQLLERLRAGKLSAEDRQRLRGHLSERCPGCSHAVARVLAEREPEIPRPIIVRPGELVRRHLAGQGPDAELEELVAPGLAAVLEAFEEAEAFQLIAEERAYQTLALATYLTEESHRQVIPDMVRAYHLARRAIAVAAHMGPTRYGQAIHYDVQGEAGMALANACRIRSRFYEARKMMDLATSLLEKGTGDVSSQARLTSFRATLAFDLGYVRDALGWLRQAEHLNAELPSAHLRNTLRAQRAAYITCISPAKATLPHSQLLRVLDRDREPSLHFCVLSNYIVALMESGHPREALHLIENMPALSSQTQSDQRRRTFWNKAKILGRIGRTRESIGMLDDLRIDFAERELGCELADVQVDLGLVCLANGNRGQAIQFLLESSSLYSSMGAEYHAGKTMGLIGTH